MGLNFCRFPDDAFHASGFHGQETGVLGLNAVIQVCAVLNYASYVRMIQPDVLVVLLMLVSVLRPGLLKLACSWTYGTDYHHHRRRRRRHHHHHHHHHHHLISQVSFPLVLLLNHWRTAQLVLQVSVCRTFLIMRDVPSTAVFSRDSIEYIPLLFPVFSPLVTI
jgi:hypothetical protein